MVLDLLQRTFHKVHQIDRSFKYPSLSAPQFSMWGAKAKYPCKIKEEIYKMPSLAITMYMRKNKI